MLRNCSEASTVCGLLKLRMITTKTPCDGPGAKLLETAIVTGAEADLSDAERVNAVIETYGSRFFDVMFARSKMPRCPTRVLLLSSSLKPIYIWYPIACLSGGCLFVLHTYVLVVHHVPTP